jgi:hypothetical protein
VLDYRREGEALFARFNAGKTEQLWYCDTLPAQFKTLSASPLVDELGRSVTELAALLRT